MLLEGLYRVRYPEAAHAGAPGTGTGALAILRNGRIFGSDRNGGVFNGNYNADTVSGCNALQLTFEVPPQGALITGLLAGSAGTTLLIEGHIAEDESEHVAFLDVGGKIIQVRLTYLGPLPN
jgi:hypothetical protein